MYFVLAAVGLFTLLVGASVRLRRPRDQATLHFFWLCVAFFGVFTFSFNGPFDRLDWAFYWGDAIAIALLPPLLLHFTLVFPERPGDGAAPATRRLGAARAADVRAGAAARRRARHRGHARVAGHAVRAAVLARARRCSIAPSRSTCSSVRRPRSACWSARSARSRRSPARRQLRWIAWGTALGVGPFAFGYALPWALGVNPPLALQLTAVLLGLVPLTFASAIVRYRLRDVEVIVKRGFAYTAFLGGERGAVRRRCAS